ncbi:O-methyltransferase [Methanospirillum sp.]
MSIINNNYIQIMRVKSNNVLTAIRLTIHRRKIKYDIQSLKNHEYENIHHIGNALIEKIDNIITPEEERYISLIEKRRSFLLKSDLVVESVDYGAGNPRSNRTKKQMREGFRSTTPVSQLCRISKSKFWALLIFKLIRKLKPVSCLELGTCLSISASYQAAALTLNKKGRLLTLEGSTESCRIAKETMEEIELKNVEVVCGPFDDTYISALSLLQPVDFLFNDGHHDHDAVLKYFEEALPYLADDAIILFDDIAWSQGMQKAWREIEDDTRVAVIVDLGAMGIEFLSKREGEKNRFSIPL